MLSPSINGVTSTTPISQTSTNGNEDELPPFVSLGDAIKELDAMSPAERELAEAAGRAQLKAEENEPDDFDYDRWREYKNQVARRNAAKIAFAEHVHATLEEYNIGRSPSEDAATFIDRKVQAAEERKKALRNKEEACKKILQFHDGIKAFSELEQDIKISDMLAFERDEDPDSLIGNRWICKGTQSVLQGPTGVGKSSLVMQMAITWSRGEKFFGIDPSRVLRTLIIQDENDLGDMAEAFQDITTAMELSDSEKYDLADVLTIKRVTGLGARFAEYLRYAITRYKPDLIFVDPLFAYAKGDVKAQEIISELMREKVAPILRETKAAMIWIHHTPKPGEQPNGHGKTAEKKKYNSFGSSEIPNIARAIIDLEEITPGLYEFNLAKRGVRAGIVDDKTLKPVTAFNIEHGNGKVVWSVATGVRADASRAKVNNLTAYEMVRDFIIERETVTAPELKSWGQRTVGVGRDSSVDHAKALCGDVGQIPRIWTYKRQAPVVNGRREAGQQPMVFSTKPPPVSFGGKPEQAENKTTEDDGRHAMTFRTKLDSGQTAIGYCVGCEKQSDRLYWETNKPHGATLRKMAVQLSERCICEVPDGKIKWFEYAE
jgi:hypothetical protein